MNRAATTVAITEFCLAIMAPLQSGDLLARAMPPPLIAVLR